MKGFKRRMRLRVPAMVTMLAATASAHGAGFQLIEVTVTGLGRAYAGGSSPGDDLSAVFYNPAELTLLQLNAARVQSGVTFISVSGEFSDEGSSRSVPTAQGRMTVPSDGRTPDDGGTDSLVPNLFVAVPVTDRISAGLGITAPFGLSTDYAKDWIGRYHALNSELKTVDINPAFSYRISDKLSVGAGISAQYADAKLGQAVFTGTPQDGFAEVSGDGWAMGWNAGISFQPDAATRIGLGFRSKVNQKVSGERRLEGVGPLSGTVGARSDVTLPESLMLTGYRALSERWAIMGTARWTRWSRFDELRVRFDDGSPDAVTVHDWNDTWFLSVGVEYRYSPALTLRAGVARDETAIPSAEFRTPRIPDSDRIWLSLGASYQPYEHLQVDVGYTHFFAENSRIDHTAVIANTPGGPVFDTLRGRYEGYVNLLGAQLSYQF